ncbi:methyl-accepting chemotaxis protein [Timonella sp. A28]|uniref:methyl-accepting chemotaxis protein n=1 Tax=Timonella sp. A28 TaxID=3442640 RepID=UPI003EB81082
MSTPPKIHKSWTDQPIFIKIATGAIAMLVAAFIALGIAFKALDDSHHRVDELFTSSVQPIEMLAALQRTYQGDRARVIQYTFSPEDLRSTLQSELREREAERAASLNAYEPHKTSQENFDAILVAFDDYYAVAYNDFFPLVDSGDIPAATEVFENEIRPATTAVMEAITAESNAKSELAQNIVETNDRDSDRALLALIIFTVVGSALALFIAFRTARKIAQRLKDVGVALAATGDGDFTVRTRVTGHDEIGALARDLSRTQDKLQDLTSRIADSAMTVAAAAERLSDGAGQVTAGSEETSAQAGLVAAASNQINRNIQTVAAGAEEMGASIREIAKNSEEAANVANNAQHVAQITNTRVSRLGQSSAEIGDVIKVITSIAEQTNLLALNATIEAARAGEAGKGFAVVASEVKELATESARAADDISKRIETIQSDTAETVAAIDEISTIIELINNYQVTIASAVEEQTSTTNEMSRSVAESATGSSEIAANIVGVATAAENNAQTVVRMNDVIVELAQTATELRGHVDELKF